MLIFAAPQKFNVFFLDKFRAYRAIFTVIENHSFLTQSLILNTHYLREQRRINKLI